MLFDTTSRFNALGNSALSPAIRQLFSSGDLEGIQGDFYWDRAIAYTSPTYEGFTANLVYARDKNDAEGNYWGGSVVWAVGLLAIEVSAQDVRVDDGIHDPTKESTWQVGASYNFGYARLFALHSQTNDVGLDVKSNLDSGGTSIPLGPGDLLVQYGLATTTGPAVDRKHSSSSLAYAYSYNSEVDIYAIGMYDTVRGQEAGYSFAAGVRYKF